MTQSFLFTGFLGIRKFASSKTYIDCMGGFLSVFFANLKYPLFKNHYFQVMQISGAI